MPHLVAQIDWSGLSWIDLSVCVGYLLLVLGLGLWFAWGQHSNEDYFVGGRRMHWVPIGLSLFAGTFSSNSFVGMPREAAYRDWHLMTSILFIPLVVTPLVAFWFIPLFFRHKVTSAYEYLGKRFDRNVQRLASVLIILYTLSWMGNLQVAVGRIVVVVLGLSDEVADSAWLPLTDLDWALIALGLLATLYTALGGVKAVIWTDALQSVALGGGMLVVLIFALGQVDGGLAGVWEIGREHDKFAMARLEFDLVSNNLYSACAFGFFAYLAAYAVDFKSVQRYVSMPSVRAAQWSLAVNGAVIIVTCLVFFLVGSTLFAFYHQTGDPVFSEFRDSTSQGDQLLPHFVMTQLPRVGLLGLMLAGLFAASMSSIDSGINSLTASVVCDWLDHRELSLRVSRGLTVLFGALAIGLALAIKRIELPIFDMLMAISGTFLGMLLGLFFLGMLSRRSNTPGLWCGLLGGLYCLALAMMFGVKTAWFGAVTATSTLVIGLAFSRLFAPPTAAQIDRLAGGKKQQ